MTDFGSHDSTAPFLVKHLKTLGVILTGSLTLVLSQGLQHGPEVLTSRSSHLSGDPQDHEHLGIAAALARGPPHLPTLPVWALAITGLSHS
jgi:hypothetical protein